MHAHNFSPPENNKNPMNSKTLSTMEVITKLYMVNNSCNFMAIIYNNLIKRSITSNLSQIAAKHLTQDVRVTNGYVVECREFSIGHLIIGNQPPACLHFVKLKGCKNLLKQF